MSIDAAVLFVSALVLDGGHFFRICAVAMLAHWLGVAVVLVRRWRSPAETDVLFIRYGIFFCIPLVLLLAPIVWETIGPSTQSGVERLLHR